MTIEFLIKASKIIEDGLRAHAKPEEAPRPAAPEPEHVYTVLHGQPIEGIPFHVVAKPEPCPWVCPVTCRACKVIDCADRLAGGADEIP